MTMVTCPECDGCGKVNLPQHLQEALDFLSENRVASTQEIYAWVQSNNSYSVGVTAINNRMRILLELGLVTRQGRGTNRDPYFWSVTR